MLIFLNLIFPFVGTNICLASQYAPKIWLRKGIERGVCSCNIGKEGPPMPQLDLLSFVNGYRCPEAVEKNQCKECREKFSCVRMLNSHLLKEHGKSEGKECPHGCGFFYNLQSHKWNKHLEKRFSCPLCDKKFSQKHSLAKHLARKNKCN